MEGDGPGWQDPTNGMKTPHFMTYPAGPVRSNIFEFSDLVACPYQRMYPAKKSLSSEVVTGTFPPPQKNLGDIPQLQCGRSMLHEICMQKGRIQIPRAEHYVVLYPIDVYVQSASVEIALGFGYTVSVSTVWFT